MCDVRNLTFMVTLSLYFINHLTLYFSDLFDWSDPSQKCKVVQTSIQRPGLLRQNSRTGSLINCNEQKIALFRHGEDVFAINEKCPHAGAYS